MKIENDKKTAIVLGGTYPHGEALIKLKKRGFYTVLIDYYDNPPAAKFADIHYKESALDLDRIIRIAKKYNTQLIISPCSDKQVYYAIKASEILNLPHPFSSEISIIATNKKFMKKIMVDNNISTSKYVVVNENYNINDINLNYPLITKPVDNAASTGIKKVLSKDDLESAISFSMQNSRRKEIIIEEYVDGDEVSVYTFVEENKVIVLATLDRITMLQDGISKCYAGLTPSKYDIIFSREFEKIAIKLAKAFHLNNTPLFFQCKINDKNISVLEFSPRFGGDMCFKIVEKYGIDLLECSIDSYLQKKVHVEKKENNGYFLVHQVYGKNGIFDCVKNEQQLLKNGIVDYVGCEKTKGMKVTNSTPNHQRCIAFLYSGKTVLDIYKKIEKTFEMIDVLDIDGASILDKTMILDYETLNYYFG